MSVRSFSTDSDVRAMPAYTLTEASHYLRVPLPTLRSWVRGRYYPVKRGKRFFRPVIPAPPDAPHLLSFLNLVEAHVLDAIRRQHEIPLLKVRTAIEFLKRHFHSDHPLAEERMETDGSNLFVERYGQLMNISQDGQLAIRELIAAHLRRVEWGTDGLGARLYPFTRKRELEEPKVVVIDPLVSFGRPVLAKTGIPTAVIAERYKAGDSMEQLADDYGRERLEIEEAIRCELTLKAA